MNRIILFLLCTIFSINIVLGDVLPEDYAQDESVPYDEVNQMIAERKGDLFPIDETTREYVDGTEDLGSATYQWNNLYLDDDIIVNTDSFFVDGSAGNVGIGTASPASDFHVNLGTDLNIQFKSLSSVAGIRARNDANSADTELQFESSEFRFIGGNVGIGTDNPSELLEASQSANSSEGIKVNNQNTGVAASAKINIASYSNALNIISFNTNHSSYADENWLYCGSGKSLVLGTDNTARLIIDSSGNVGIGGVSTPAGQVEILASSGAQLVLSQDEGVDECLFTLDGSGELYIEPSSSPARTYFNTSSGPSQIWVETATDDTASIYFKNTNGQADIYLDGDAEGLYLASPGELHLGGSPNIGSEQISSVVSNTISISTCHVLFNGMSTNQSVHTINGFGGYTLLFMSNSDSSETATITHGTGNIRLAGGADCVMSQYDTIVLMYQLQTSNWVEISRSNNN